MMGYSISSPRIERLQETDVMETVGGVASLEERSTVAKEPLIASSRAAGLGGLSVRICEVHAMGESGGGSQE